MILVKKVFEILDFESKGSISIDHIKKVYNVEHLDDFIY